MEKTDDTKKPDDEIKKDDKKKGKKGIKNQVDFSPTLDEALEQLFVEIELAEALLSAMQRRKRAMSFRRNKAKVARGRRIAMNRRASKETLEKRATKQARNVIRKKIIKDKSYNDLSPGEKAIVDARVQKRQAAIKRIAQRLLPKVRKDDAKRLSSIKEEEGIVVASKDDDKSEPKKKRFHQLLNKDGTVKHDMRFKMYWNSVEED